MPTGMALKNKKVSQPTAASKQSLPVAVAPQALDPDALLDMAEQAPTKIRVEPYWSTVTTLRAKNYSWREISAWLSERGVDLHYKRLERHAKALEFAGSEQGDDEDAN